MAPLETGWLPETPVDDTVLRSFVFNQCDANTIFADASGGHVESTEDVHLTRTPTPVPFFNEALLLRPVMGVDDAVLDTIDAFYAGFHQETTLLSLWPTPDLADRGWRLWGHPMLCVLAPTASEYRPPGRVEVKLVETEDDLAIAEHILAVGFGMNELAGAPRGSIYHPDLLGTALEVRLGLLDGEPVATASRHQAYGVTNLTMGATLPAARRRGVWRALVWDRIRPAPELPTVTYTSDDSRPGFVAMGFLPMVRLTLWGRG